MKGNGGASASDANRTTAIRMRILVLPYLWDGDSFSELVGTGNGGDADLVGGYNQRTNQSVKVPHHRGSVISAVICF